MELIFDLIKTKKLNNKFITFEELNIIMENKKNTVLEKYFKEHNL